MISLVIAVRYQASKAVLAKGAKLKCEERKVKTKPH
jgi:hypothetical protein